MSGAKVQVRELAAWGLDRDEYRPASYRGHPDSACTLVSGRARFEGRPALLEADDCRLRELFAAQRLRADLCAEMAGLDWSLGVVDLRLLLAFQRRIVAGPEARDAQMPAADDWDRLMEMCFAKRAPVVCDAARSDASVLLRSANPNLRARITEDSFRPIEIHSGSPFFEVAQYDGRWFLRDGYHRAYRCLRRGIYHLPAVVVHARTIAELGAGRPWFFPEEVLFSDVPPRVVDFLEDALVIEYDRSPLIKTLRITVEESYSLEGENDEHCNQAW